MIEIIGTDIRPEEREEFLTIVHSILHHPDFIRLQNYTHHHYTTRYQHCLNVAWYSYRISKREHLQYISCTKGALLHDFYLYDSHLPKSEIRRRLHLQIHPRIAWTNAKARFSLDPIMEDCILHHMWPIDKNRPLTREGRIVSQADKYCAALEWSSHWSVTLELFLKTLLGNALHVKE